MHGQLPFVGDDSRFGFGLVVLVGAPFNGVTEQLHVYIHITYIYRDMYVFALVYAHMYVIYLHYIFIYIYSSPKPMHEDMDECIWST